MWIGFTGPSSGFQQGGTLSLKTQSSGLCGLDQVGAPELRRLAQSQEPEQLQVQSACGTMEGSLRVTSFRQGKVDFPFAFFCEQFTFLITRSKLFQKRCQPYVC